MATVNVEARTARCDCGKQEPSSFSLAFFEYQGEGSRYALNTCANCRYFEIAHRPGHHDRICDNFVAIGPAEFDRYYCGHRGWD